MIADNEWHLGIVAHHADGSFGVYDSFEEVEKSGIALTEPPDFKAIKYNWNRGQPIVDFGDFTMSIVDSQEKT